MTLSRAASLRSANSETSSAGDATERLRKRHGLGTNQDGDGEEEEDLLEQNKTLQEAVFSAMYCLSRSRTADSWRWATLKLVLEGLVPFLVVFNPHHWPLDTGNPVWQVVRWAQPVTPVATIWGYRTYVNIFYALVCLIYSVVISIGVLTLAMRRQEHSRWLHRFAQLLQKFTDALFNMAYVAVFDYIMFLFNCRFGSPGHPHNYWSDVQCLSGHHIILLAVGAVTAVVFFLATALMLVASCDLSPVATGITASPAAVTRLQVLVLKALFVVAADTLVAVGKPQAVVMLVLALGICWLNFRALPFLRLYVNDIWVAVWVAVSYLCTIHVVMDLRNDKEAGLMTRVVLYGTFPALVTGAVVTAVWSRWRLRPAAAYRGLDIVTARQRKLNKFSSPADVEVVARVMRHFDSEGVILEEAAQLGETIIKCGMAVFPGHVGLLILYANFLMEVKRDGPAARTQLQLALKAGPSLVQRYQIFSTIENSKRLKDGQEGQLDLQSYVEFKRNYRAVIRVHKASLAAQREVWQLMQHPAVKAAAMDAALRALDATAEAAHRVYRRVLERYPHNGKLLRCYGKFLEDVRHDPVSAARAYADAARNGGGDGLLSLDLKITGSDKPEFLASMDLHDDACIVINAEGKILMVNACVTDLLGYPRSELEGSNVSMIMPQPFSSRHTGYISRYVQGGEPHILDTVRDVVALHKDRYVFPLQLCVTKLSGVGTDAIFLGLLRPQPLDSRNMRAWVAPNGVILCTDPQFSSLTGLLGEEMVGRNFRTLCTDIAAVDAMLESCRTAPYEQLVAGEISFNLEMAHRYLPPMPVRITVKPGGTDSQRIFVMNAQRVCNADTGFGGGGSSESASAPFFSSSSSSSSCSEGLIVVDARGGLVFATWDVAAMLGYPMRSFLRLRLEQLLPEPFATLHVGKYLREAPATIPPVSCRAGRLVHLVNSNGAQVPVRLKITTREDDGGGGGGGGGGGRFGAVGGGGGGGSGHVRHVIQVNKVDTNNDIALHADRRLVLTCSMDGSIVFVDQPSSALFGFSASACVGSNLADCIDVFSEWRTKAGAHQTELLLLSLLDKEAEMPGTSWRVKVHSPETAEDGELRNLPPSGNVDAKVPTRRPVGRSACLQTELVETVQDERNRGSGGGGGFNGGGGGGGGAQASGSHAGSFTEAVGAAVKSGAVVNSSGGGGTQKILARIILWRRDILTGTVELDEQLVVRKADISTGLIVGLPPSSLPKMPLSRLLDVNRGISWEDLMLSDNHRSHKPSALKGSTTAVVSEPKAFIGPHPDGGTMRIILQGVSSLGSSSGRILVTLHPDTSYVGARANLYRALGLEAIIHNQQQQQSQQPGQQGRNPDERLPLQRPTPRAVLPRSDSVANPRVGPAAATSTTDPWGGGAAAPAVAGAAAPGAVAADAAKPSTLCDVAGLGAGGGVATQAGGGYSGTALGGSGSQSSSSLDSDGSAGGGGGGRLERLAKGDGGGSGGSDDGGANGEGDGDQDSSDDDDDDDGDDDGDDEDKERKEDADGTKLHVRAHTQSEFVESWVRSLSRQMTAARERISNSAAASREPSSKSLLAAPLPPGGGSRPLSRAPAAAAAAASSSDDQHTRAVLVRASTRLLASGLVAAASFRRQGTTEAPAADPLEFNNVPIWEDRLRSSTRARTPRWGAALASSSGGGRRLAAVAAAARAAAAAAAAAAAVSAADPDDGARDIVMADAFGSGRKARMADVADEVQQLDAAAGGSWKGKESLAVAAAIGGGSGRGGGGGSSIGDDDGEGSQGANGGPGALSDFTSVVEVELSTDARRARLLKRMTRILSGPSLEQPLSRLLTHTLVLLAAMLATHVICYIVLMGLINSQYAHVHEIHRVALASDRTQVSVIKAAAAEFCSRPGIAPVCVCEVPLTSHLLDLMEALNDLESYHHNVYLGTDVASAGGKSRGQTPRKIDQGGLYDMWTKSALPYQVYMDLESPSWVNLTAGVWQLGNRFVATCRELLYWGQRLGGNISHIRSFQFVQANGPWSLFQAYTASLDYLARMAWEDVAALQHSLLIILLVEAIAIQLSCIVYEWWLVRKVEMRRRGALLVPLGLPGPVLRLLSNRPLVVMEDSDDEAESEEGAAGHAGDGDGMGPYRRSLDGNADGAIAADAASTATTQGHIRRFADGGGAVHRTHHRASIDFAPLRSGAYLGTASGGGGKVSLERHLRLTEAADAASQHHHYGRMSVEVLGPHGSGGGGAATGAVAESPTAAAAPVRQAPEVTVDPRNAEVAAHLEQTPLLKDRTDEVGSERAAPVRQCVMVLGGAGGGGSVSSITVAAASDGVSGGGGPGRRNAVAVISESHGSQLAVNGKHLTANSRNMLRFLVPLLLWEVALATIGGLSYYWLEGMQGPLASLNMASHVIYRYTRVRMLALLLVSGSTPLVRSRWRNVLSAELVNLRDEYDTLLYGGVALTQAGSVFQKAVPASTFESSSFAGNFFTEERCFRWDQSKCYTPDSPYYQLTHHGLDSMMRRVVSELELLVADDDADAVYNGTRYTTMYMVGTKDLYEGLQSSAQLFVDFMIGRYQNVKLLHTLLLVATIVLFVTYALLVLRPYLAGVAQEAHRLAGLLSHVPADMDVATYARNVMRAAARAMQANGGGGGGGGSAAATAAATAAGDGGSGERRRRTSGPGAGPTMVPGSSAATAAATGVHHRRSSGGGKGAGSGGGRSVAV